MSSDNRDSSAVLWLGLALFLVSSAAGQDAPHAYSTDFTCASCHIEHHLFGNQIASTAGNANLCLSCHLQGGRASTKPFADVDQAVPWPTGPQELTVGTSHRWDAGLSGRVEARDAAGARIVLRPPATRNASQGSAYA